MQRRISDFAKCLLITGVMMFAALVSHAVGLRVGPSEVSLKNVAPGALYDFQKELGIALTIYNDSEERETYAISSLKSSEINNVPEGYDDIPDPNWLHFNIAEIEVAPNGSEKVMMYLNVPYDKRYYSQRWVVSIRVKSVPKAGEGISLACHPRIKIETINEEGSRMIP